MEQLLHLSSKVANVPSNGVKASSRCGHLGFDRRLTVGSLSLHKHNFLFKLSTLLLLLALSVGNVWAEITYTQLVSITSGDVVTNNSYTAYNTTVSSKDYVITFGGNNKSVGTNSGNRSKCNLSNYSKYAVSPVTTSSVASAFACKTSISNVGKISYTFNGGSNQTNTNVYVLYSSDNTTFTQVALTKGTQGASISSGTEYTFAKCSGYFALLFVATNSSGNWRIDDVSIKLYEAEEQEQCSNTITISKETPTNGSFSLNLFLPHFIPKNLIYFSVFFNTSMSISATFFSA